MHVAPIPLQVIDHFLANGGGRNDMKQARSIDKTLKRKSARLLAAQIHETLARLVQRRIRGVRLAAVVAHRKVSLEAVAVRECAVANVKVLLN